MNIYTLQTPKACPLIGIFCMYIQKIYKCTRLLAAWCEGKKPPLRRFLVVLSAKRNKLLDASIQRPPLSAYALWTFVGKEGEKRVPTASWIA
jgi:hypothetical protein